MKDKHIVITFIISSFIIATIFFATLFIYDPLKIFHKPWFYKNYLKNDKRVTAAGMLNNMNYNSIILGTSMLENTSSKNASNILGSQFINISIPGSDYYERSIVLKYALEKKPIKLVLFSLDDNGLVYQRRGHIDYSVDKFNFLYNKNIFDDFSIYINPYYLKCLFSIGDKSKCMGEKNVNMDRPFAWYNNEENKCRFGGLKNWVQHKDILQMSETLKTIKQTVKKLKNEKIQVVKKINKKAIDNYLQSTLLTYIKRYNKTKFILIIPPYPRFHAAIYAQVNKNDYSKYIYSIKSLLNKTKAYKNVEIYGWGNHKFVDNIANYKDTIHYNNTINSWMLSAIKKKEGLLNSANIDNYLNTFTKKALKYNLPDLQNKIDRLTYSNTITEINYNHSGHKIFDLKQATHYKKNNQLNLLNTELTITGNDPILYLKNLKTHSKFVKLTYNINSKVRTKFQIFYKDKLTDKYSEINSFKKIIKKGKNQISLSIPSKYINNTLRVDLVANIGKYKLNDFSLYEIIEKK